MRKDKKSARWGSVMYEIKIYIDKNLGECYDFVRKD